MKNWAGAIVLAVMACRAPDGAVILRNGDTPYIPGNSPITAERYAIGVGQPDNGAIGCRASAAAGAVVKLTLSPQGECYRYRAGSLAVEPEVELVDMGGGVWAFTMPDGPVSITAEFEEIPIHAITLAEGVENGSFSVTGEAREGSLVTVAVMPDPGYKLADGGLCVTPAGAVAFTRVEGQLAWNFNMADIDLEIGVAFAELGPLEIYKGGARRGISAGELSDDKKYFANSINMESEEPGRGGNRQAIKISHALNANGNGNAVQQSFGLFSDTEIDLEAAAALSFWARANRQLNIRYVGFGDADPDRRVVYTGENYNQQISIGAEWKRYVVPVPAFRNGRRAARVFFFNALLSIDNYVCIDDIEFVQTGVTLTEIVIPDANDGLFYGATDTAKILKGAPIKLAYICDDGAIVTLQNAINSHTLKYSLAPWLAPFVETSGNGVFSVNMAGIGSNPMTARIIDGFLLDDFEDIAGTGSVTVPGDPVEGTGYLWHTTSSGSAVVYREYFTAADSEIHRGLRAGSWRPAATANTPRGGRNFAAKDASAYGALTFWIKVTARDNTAALQKNTAFTFELKNGGALAVKASGAFFARQFTYNTDNADGWQEIVMPLADFVGKGLDLTAITGYAFGVVDNQGSGLRIMLDDIAFVP